MPHAPFVGTHYPDKSVAEDVSDLIYEISPQSHPFYNMIGEVASTGVLHEWQRRELTTYSDNAKPEGVIYDFTAPQRLPVRLYNVNQIVENEIRVSNTQQAIRHYGIRDPFGDQMATKMREHGTDLERAVIQGTLGTGATGTARRLQGMVNAIVSGITTYTTAAGTGLDEGVFNDVLQACWNLGAEPADCFVGGVLKRTISGFTSTSTQFLRADERRLVRSVGLYESDFFPVEIHISRTIPVGGLASNATNQTGYGLLLVDRTMLAKAWLRRTIAKTIPETADSKDGVIISELTLEYGHPNAHWFYDNLT